MELSGRKGASKSWRFDKTVVLDLRIWFPKPMGPTASNLCKACMSFHPPGCLGLAAVPELLGGAVSYDAQNVTLGRENDSKHSCCEDFSTNRAARDCRHCVMERVVMAVFSIGCSVVIVSGCRS